MGRVDGKVAIITGCASGMGLAAAELFAREGAKVVATDRAIDQLKREMDAIGNPNILALEHDIASEADWQKVVDAAIAKFGKIDILVNNAGISNHTGILEETIDGWNKVIAINLTAVWLGMKAVVPHMQKNGKGAIVNTSSLASMLGGKSFNGAAYSASKGGVAALTKNAAQAFAKDSIRVNSLHPGMIFTGMAKAHGVKSVEQMGQAVKDKDSAPLPPYVGEAIDIAHGYLYLASDESKFVTGVELVVDGGWATH